MSSFSELLSVKAEIFNFSFKKGSRSFFNSVANEILSAGKPDLFNLFIRCFPRVSFPHLATPPIPNINGKAYSIINATTINEMPLNLANFLKDLDDNNNKKEIKQLQEKVNTC